MVTSRVSWVLAQFFGGKASFTQPIASICISLFTKTFANHNHSPAPVRVPCQYALVLPQRDGVWTTTSFTSAHTVALPCALQNIYCRQFQCTISPLVWREREKKRKRNRESGCERRAGNRTQASSKNFHRERRGFFYGCCLTFLKESAQMHAARNESKGSTQLSFAVPGRIQGDVFTACVSCARCCRCAWGVCRAFFPRPRQQRAEARQRPTQRRQLHWNWTRCYSRC